MYCPKYHCQNHRDNSIRWLILTMLLAFYLFYTPNANAGFCWDLNKRSCDYMNTPPLTHFYPYGKVNANGQKTLNSGGSGHKFRFRSDQNWTLTLDSFEHVGTLQNPNTPVKQCPDGSNDKDCIKLHIHSSSFDHDHYWMVGESHSGSGFSGNNGDYSKNTYLKLDLKQDMWGILGPGNHSFIFNITGRNNEDGSSQKLQYIFGIDIGISAGISGLEPFNLGTFPDHDDAASQSVCVFVTGGGEFTIKAESRNGGAGSNAFYLATPTVPGYQVNYKPYFGQLYGEMTEINNSEKNLDIGGSREASCFGEDNMRVEVRMETTFQQLSQLPAGTYTDTLTLIVEPDSQ